MAITYTETAALMQDTEFDGRVRVACLRFAQYIQGEATNVPAHSTRLRWAQDTFKNPDVASNTIKPALVMDPAVQSAGAAITDAALQTSVEASVNMLI